jgi:hypothetical protein
MFKQNPATFMLSGLNGSYAFSEVGSLLLPGSPANGNPQSAVGLAIFDGQGNFVNGSTVDINNAGNLQTSSAISGTYALTNETVSNGPTWPTSSTIPNLSSSASIRPAW